MPPAFPVKLVIDTDGGFDDAVAMWWAAASADVELVAITTVHGNVDIDTATDNACRVLHACGAASVPVARGHATALGPAIALAVSFLLPPAPGRRTFGPEPAPATL